MAHKLPINRNMKMYAYGPTVYKQACKFPFINPFPCDKILDETKLEAFADDKLNVTKMIISLFDRVENIVRKEKILVTSIFLLFPQCFLSTPKRISVFKFHLFCHLQML